jgi:hypothetical protein
MTPLTKLLIIPLKTKRLINFVNSVYENITSICERLKWKTSGSANAGD